MIEPRPKRRSYCSGRKNLDEYGMEPASCDLFAYHLLPHIHVAGTVGVYWMDDGTGWLVDDQGKRTEISALSRRNPTAPPPPDDESVRETESPRTNVSEPNRPPRNDPSPATPPAPVDRPRY